MADDDEVGVDEVDATGQGQVGDGDGLTADLEVAGGGQPAGQLRGQRGRGRGLEAFGRGQGGGLGADGRRGHAVDVDGADVDDVLGRGGQAVEAIGRRRLVDELPGAAVEAQLVAGQVGAAVE